MTKKFVKKLGFEEYEIPLRPRDPTLEMQEGEYFILATPTLGGGNDANKKHAVPKQVIKFLNVRQNREQCLGIIASGNSNFGNSYVLAGRIISGKLQVPLLGVFELSGMPGQENSIRENIEEHWEDLLKTVRERYSDSG